ncbi:glutamate:Na+ symporter, ESS family [Lentibacillus persicus]|uniref:Glutamate:Na+ symporter, ESS family n=1 Tax=Lentibacillus persicus TaxID=640948 RepID=A0A1I1VWG3_9BACI|nr:sodium/glutamate symporter [Lentibacillus persicus]SFD87079.1 glutamate:Na+ symporter, ESS family [Lentibacillus persicus]
MIAFGLASIMLCIGLIIRTKVPFISKMLVPASVVGGVIGLVVMNTGLITAVDSQMYVDIVTLLFTVTFISIGLTSNPKSQSSESVGKSIAKGSIGLGFLWNLVYALTPAVGALIIIGIGGFFKMAPIYGLLIPFAFTQGPGQSATFGGIMEQQYGIANAATVGVTFAALGFLLCFLVGVPLARYGIKKGLAKNMGTNKIEGFVKRGYYVKNDKRESLGNETMFSGNIDTMTFHFAIIGVCFLIALGMAEIVSFIPAIGSTFSGMLFIYGMLAGYLVKFVMKKLRIENMLDNTFQSKITGWSTDYLIVASFMAVPFSVIGNWMIPILIVSIVVMILSVMISIYFGQRMGGDNDFERTVGLYGTVTGTVPSGIALVRIIDPSLRTSTAVELGLMNLPMMASFVTVSTIMAIASGALSMSLGILLLLAPIPIYLIILKLFKVWGTKTYDFKSASGSEVERLKRATAE